MASVALSGYQHDTEQEFSSHTAASDPRSLQYPPRTSEVSSFAKVRQLLRIDGMGLSHTNKAF